jgi:hypothetical protein
MSHWWGLDVNRRSSANRCPSKANVLRSTDAFPTGWPANRPTGRRPSGLKLGRPTHAVGARMAEQLFHTIGRPLRR